MAIGRSTKVSSPLGEDVLRLRHLRGTEELGRLFHYELDLVSEDEQINLQDVLGQPMTVHFELADGSFRYFSGLVTRFSQSGRRGNYVSYRARISPWLWFLTRRADCRIFQEMTVPDIIKQVFRDLGFTDFTDELTGSYRTWNYCVQYRETDFNFVSRLMEQEGIYYYFKHEEDKHSLVLSDSISAHEATSSYEEIPYSPPDNRSIELTEHFSSWQQTQEVQPGAFAITDYDFERPKTALDVLLKASREHDQADFEVYDYPGEYIQTSDGDNYVKARLEERGCQFHRFSGRTNAEGMAVGALFNLIDYPREDQNREYLILSTRTELSVPSQESGDSDEGTTFDCSVTSLASDVPFRSARITPKPVVQGPQTAVVVGKEGEEIWTDKYGRVKVQFHWDRIGENDENSSCWVRVSQLWAGKGWGGIHIPRIGHEVIIEFLEGDPDRPIVTGRVYNADNMPPYALPDDQTMSGIKSRSSKEGTEENFNEIRFEDKKDKEELYIHAEKDQNTIVENDRNQMIGHDKTENVGNDKSIEVGNEHSEKIGSNMTINVGSNLTETVGVNYAETVGAAMELTIGAAYVQTVGAAKQVTVGGARSETIAKSASLIVGQKVSETIGKEKEVDIGKDFEQKVGGKKVTKIEKECVFEAKKVQITAKDEITFKAGKAEITLKKNGDITIKGKKINVKGSGDVIIKGSKIKEN